MSEDLTATAISTWFDDCHAIEISNNRLFLHTPSVFKKSIIEGRFIGSINSALGEIFSGDYEVIILDDDGYNAMAESSDKPDYLGIDEYTFEHFVVGNSNKLAHAAALAVAEGQQKQNYNPLFIYGESGLGKTHLLYAIRHAVEMKHPNYNIVYVKGEDFTNELIKAIQQGKNVEFRDKYRGADLFLMDDIQFIAGKIETQEEFFNTFNALYELGKQIAFTSDRPPQEIYRLEDRLKTRFESGLLADIQPPDDALRIAIIRNKSEQLGVVLPDDVTYYIADNLSSNIRQLEGAVKMIIAYRDIMDDDITVASVTKRLKDMFKGNKDLIPTIDRIIAETAKFYALTPEDLKGQRRTRDTALARQIAMYLIRKLTNYSLKDIGHEFEGRDHTTVLSSIRRIEATIEDSPDLSRIIRDITSNINSRS
jgi:chromosomal replication initiator protein